MSLLNLMLLFKEYEPVLGSTSDVNDFVTALAVKKMYDLYLSICLCKEEYMHEFRWMMQWLNTSVELSEEKLYLLVLITSFYGFSMRPML